MKITRLLALIAALGLVSTTVFSAVDKSASKPEALSFYDGISTIKVAAVTPSARSDATPSTVSPRTEVDRRTILLAQADTKPAIRGTFQVEKPAPAVPPATGSSAGPSPSIKPIDAPAPAVVTTPAPDATLAPVPATRPVPAPVQLAPISARQATAPSMAEVHGMSAPASVPNTTIQPPKVAKPVPVDLPVKKATKEVKPAASVQAPITERVMPHSMQQGEVANWPANVPKPGTAGVGSESARLITAPQVKLPLPGIGVLPGAQRLTPSAVRVQENSLEEVFVSSTFPNRIATPFANPRIIDSSASDISKEGSSVFITLTSKTPVAIYITGDRANDPVIGLLLKPAELPPQVIVLSLDERLKAVPGSDDGSSNTPSSYTAQLTQVLKTVALGKTPTGFSGGEIPMSMGRMGNLALRTEMRFSGRDMEVFTYWVTNITKEPLVLDESMFYVQGVRAVAFFPETQLAPNQSTRVLIVSETKTEVQ